MSWNDQPQHIRVYPLLERWCDGYERFFEGRKQRPQIDHPDAKQWKIIALGALKRLVRDFEIESEPDMRRFIDWYWDVYAKRIDRWLEAQKGKRFEPSSPVNKSFRKAFESWLRAKQ